MATHQSRLGIDSATPLKKRYHAPKIVRFGSIQALPDAGLRRFDSDRANCTEEIAEPEDQCADHESNLPFVAHCR